MNSKQSSLSDTLSDAKSKGYLNMETLSELQSEFESLSIPTHENNSFDKDSWITFIHTVSGVESLELRNEYDEDTPEFAVLSAIAIHHTQDESLVDDAFNITVTGYPKEWLPGKSYTFITEMFQRIPITVLLTSWIPEIFICGKSQYTDIVGMDSSGYYHPEEHWIAVSWDAGCPDSDGWPVSFKSESERYEKSVLIHEFGHALHYMLGLQTVGCEEIDNSDKTASTAEITIREDSSRNEWQSEFCLESIKAYGLLLNETYPKLTWGGHEKTTVEEFVAEGFCVYLTAPRYLASEYRLLYNAFSELTL